MSTETKGPITAVGTDYNPFSGPGEQFRIRFTGEQPKGHISWEVFNQLGASVATGTSSVSQLPSGSQIGADWSSAGQTGEWRMKIVYAGKCSGLFVNSTNVQIDGSGHAEVLLGFFGT